MTECRKAKKVTQDMIYRAVASSIAIEVGLPTQFVEKKLRANRAKYSSYALASD